MSARSTPLSDVPNGMEIDIKSEASPGANAVVVKAEEDEAMDSHVTPDRQVTPETQIASGAEETLAETPVPATPMTPGSLKRLAIDCAEDDSPMKKTKGRASPKNATPSRQRKAPAKTPSSGRAIATTIEQLSAEDRLLITMKDQGKSWKEIGEAWKMVTGVAPAKSTLPNRYARLRANITTMSEADQQNLLAAKAHVEQKQEQEKWEQIAQRMQELGSTEKFSIGVLQKQLAKMEAARVQPEVNPFDEVAE